MIDFIHCIENKKSYYYDTKVKLLLNSFVNLSPLLYKNSKVNFLQPTNNDISEETINLFKKLNCNFIKIPNLSNKQINSENNYTNVCVTCDYFSKKLKNDFMCWLDLDVVFLQECNLNFFKNTDKIVFTIFDNDNDMSKKDKSFKLNVFYKELFRPYISQKFFVDHIEKYINTWFIYGPRNNSFWSEWKELTYELIDITHKFHQDQIYKGEGLESICEEIAASILYSKNSNNFINTKDFFGENYLAFREVDVQNVEGMECDENTLIYHYNNFGGFYRHNFSKQKYKNNILKIIFSNFNKEELGKFYDAKNT